MKQVQRSMMDVMDVLYFNDNYTTHSNNTYNMKNFGPIVLITFVWTLMVYVENSCAIKCKMWSIECVIGDA